MRTIKGFVFTKDRCFKPGSVTIDSGVIVSVSCCAETGLSEDERNTLILPGLIDIHMHGAAGTDVCNASCTELLKLAEYEVNHGVTSFFPTTMTLPAEKLETICKTIAGALEICPAIKGINLEGPFVSEKKCGAQNRENAVLPDSLLLNRLNAAGKGRIRFVTVAPELKGAMDFIAGNAGKYVVSVGHSDADYDTASKSFELGARQVTHLYNAMTPFLHRNPGIPGAAFDNENVMAELIADGEHVHPSVVRNTFKAIGADRIILISDSTEGTGEPAGEYILGGQKIIHTGSVAKLPDGTIAGSVSTLYDCLVSAVKMGIPAEDAIVAATISPARAAGLDSEYGTLEPGKKADILVTDKSFEIREVLLNV